MGGVSGDEVRGCVLIFRFKESRLQLPGTQHSNTSVSHQSRFNRSLIVSEAGGSVLFRALAGFSVHLASLEEELPESLSQKC